MSIPDTFSLALLVEAYACNARVEGMRTANAAAYWKNETPPFVQSDFQHEASTLQYLSESLRGRAG